MAMVLAATTMMMAITMYETIWIATMIASVIDTKLMWKAFSVSVRVSAREFLNMESTASATSGASPGLFTPTTK